MQQLIILVSVNNDFNLGPIDWIPSLFSCGGLVNPNWYDECVFLEMVTIKAIGLLILVGYRQYLSVWLQRLKPTSQLSISQLFFYPE